MKKIITAVLAVSLVLSMAGCSGGQNKNTAQTAQPATSAPQKTKYQAAYAQKTIDNITLDIPSSWQEKQNGAAEHSFYADENSYCTVKIIDSTTAADGDFQAKYIKQFEELKDFSQSSGVNANGVPYVIANGKDTQNQSKVDAYLLTDGKNMYTVEMYEAPDSANDYSDTIKHIIDSVKIVEMPKVDTNAGAAAAAKGANSAPAAGTSGKMTLAVYDKINNGMTYDEVVALVGEKPASESEAELMGEKAKVCSWLGKAGNGANAAIEFQNGKVASKTQVGLQ